MRRREWGRGGSGKASKERAAGRLNPADGTRTRATTRGDGEGGDGMAITKINTTPKTRTMIITDIAPHINIAPTKDNSTNNGPSGRSVMRGRRGAGRRSSVTAANNTDTTASGVVKRVTATC